MPVRILGRRIGWAGAGAVALAIAAVALWSLAIDWHPSIKKYPIQGVDVSQRQGEIDWATLHARGADFAYVRATSGAGERDARFAENWQGAADAGLRRGATHLWSFCRPAVDQANNFITTVPRSDDALPAVLELDFTADCDARPAHDALIADLIRFLQMVETHTGEPMLLKISRPVTDAYHPGAAIARPLWLARDFLKPNYGERPWRIWQASDLRRTDGVAGPVHWDVVAP